MPKSARTADRRKKLKKNLQAEQRRRDNKEAVLEKMQDINRYGRSITRRQFDAFCFCRMPLVRFTAEEVEWYSLFDNKILGLIIRDVTDDDFGFIILGRDTRRLFRCIDIQTAAFFATPQEARKALAERLGRKYEGQVQDTYEQYDEKDPTLDLFTPIIPEEKQHWGFKVLANEQRHEAARNLITEIANSFIDNDGHYEREFQSENFHARLWELYLHMYFHSEGLEKRNEHVAPDFELNWFGDKYFVEAVTVNPSGNKARPDLPPPTNEDEIRERLNDFMPIKFGSPLYSKLQMRYWEKPHVSGHPLIFAIHDYHNATAMTWSRIALSEYLYGIRTRIIDGSPVMEKIEKHQWEGKEIPSGFFNQPDAESISAVLFSNQATIPKFNRMGKLAGLGGNDLKMIRAGDLYNPDPKSFKPIPYSKDIDDPDYEESWSDGLVMFHNPNAKHPVDEIAFKDISHIHYSEEKGFYGHHQPYDFLNSITYVFQSEK
jgi:hypothetical protein